MCHVSVSVSDSGGDCGYGCRVAEVSELEVPLRRHWSKNNFRMGSRGHESGKTFKPWGLNAARALEVGRLECFTRQP